MVLSEEDSRVLRKLKGLPVDCLVYANQNRSYQVDTEEFLLLKLLQLLYDGLTGKLLSMSEPPAVFMLVCYDV